MPQPYLTPRVSENAPFHVRMPCVCCSHLIIAISGECSGLSALTITGNARQIAATMVAAADQAPPCLRRALTVWAGHSMPKAFRLCAEFGEFIVSRGRV